MESALVITYQLNTRDSPWSPNITDSLIIDESLRCVLFQELESSLLILHFYGLCGLIGLRGLGRTCIAINEVTVPIVLVWQ
jgi:hypothetical protein